MPVILWVYISVLFGYILVATFVSLLLKLIEQLSLKKDIKSLWRRRKRLEQFIRPNHVYERLFSKDKSQYEHYEYIDDKTWSDLNLDEVYQQLNYNFTSIGEMRLYASLRGMDTVKNERLIQDIKERSQFREKISLYLAMIGKAVYPLYPDQVHPLSRNIFKWLSPFYPLIGFVIMFMSAKLGGLLTLLAIILNVYLSTGQNRDKMKNNEDSAFYTVGVIKQANRIAHLAESPRLNIDLNHFKIVKYFGWLIGGIGSKSEAALFIGIIKSMFNLDYFLYFLLQRSFMKHEDEIMAAYNYLSYIDNHYAVALWRETLTQEIRPEVTECKNIKFRGVVHPLLAEAVPNDLSIQSHILLTGSNASGKSTFMKAVALNLILAQSVNTALAEQFTYKPGSVYTSMANQDDVLTGDSYFMAEIKAIRRLFKLSHADYCYCFIDEIFKGTNTTERIAASESVLNYLGERNNYRVLAATHDIELATWLHPLYANYHFNEVIQDKEIYFDYKIKPGKANTRNAIELLRITQFPETIYKQALKNTTKLESNS
ncbi:MutS family DNA mismatch repair protein [Staphylococcus sp. SQ8-PEA]|uniref:MutS family DNA mismatch repair protein n=1 Tax=Staphylococcus marylandisciuri TaxID=2981529 RepID=A0ABT2QQC3_9STAP|nr:MutS family DNA mismatch repair protein [Staphylococcus marylandisciuri]MCU5746153.1 MutS family DNA mismatch repair protein [Staphylococcus marylandisciuri]